MQRQEAAPPSCPSRISGSRLGLCRLWFAILPKHSAFQYRQEAFATDKVAAVFHFCPKVAKGKDAKIPAFIKSAWQEMLQEAADKLPCFQRNTFQCRPVSIIIVPKHNVAIFKSFDPVVVDCHPVGVVAQVVYNSFWSCKLLL